MSVNFLNKKLKTIQYFWNFSKNVKQAVLPNSFYQTRASLTQKQDKDITRKGNYRQNTSEEYRFKNSEVNSRKKEFKSTLKKPKTIDDSTYLDEWMQYTILTDWRAETTL